MTPAGTRDASRTDLVNLPGTRPGAAAGNANATRPRFARLRARIAGWIWRLRARAALHRARTSDAYAARVRAHNRGKL